MTKEEIVKAADQTINEFKKIFEFTGDKYGVDTLLDCVILHYEKIVERDKDIDTISLHCDKSPYWRKKTHEAELILAELKIRL